MLIVMGDLRCGILLDVKTRARAVLATASGTHFVHDGFSDILYVLLPIWAQEFRLTLAQVGLIRTDRKSTRLNSSHSQISYAVFCLKKKKTGHPRLKTGEVRLDPLHLR